MGCEDETISGYVDSTSWKLTEINGKAFNDRAILSFPSQGRVEGKAPCNGFAAEQTAPYPWFKLGPILSTKMGCPNLDAEDQFLTSLAAMRIAETLSGTLILSNEQGQTMVFIAE